MVETNPTFLPVRQPPDADRYDTKKYNPPGFRQSTFGLRISQHILGLINYDLIEMLNTN
ncbi:MAG: hypothetical protein KAX28_14135 [Candidatus Marinimicrobia bacterium]|nr:hypothetical protein [Candidatus Neomarinimicrobiota bacterium]